MNKNLIYPLFIIIAASSYGTLSTMVKVAMAHGFTTAQAVQSQYAIGFLLALILFLITQRTFPKMSGKGLLIIVLCGLFTGITGIVYGKSVQYLPASLAVVMLFQFTWIGLFLDCIVHKRLPKRVELISLIFLVGGTILAAGVLDVDLTGLDWKGWAFGFSAAFSFACFMQFNSKQVAGVSTIARMTIMALIALIVVSLFQAPEIMWTGDLFTTDLIYFGLALGFFGIILPILLFTIAVPKVGGGTASILSATELPVAILASVIVLGESLSPLQIVGILLVLIGMTFPTIIENKKERAKLHLKENI
ncbi:MAG: DMT family transporter [Kurthia sp.]